MILNQFKPVVIALVSAGFAVAGSVAQAGVVNGSLTGPISNGGVPPGWSVLTGSPDTMDANNNVGVSGLLDFGAAPSATPDGGTWVGIGAGVGFIETFGQTVGGLTAGTTYTIAWYAGNFGYSPGTFGYINPNAINALVNGVSVGTGATLSLGSNWFLETATFTAISSSANLEFQLATDARSYMSIDGISVTAVPEPETYVLMLGGLAVLGTAFRRRKAV